MDEPSDGKGHMHRRSRMKVNIEYLADHPGSVPILARWLFDEWGHRAPDGSIDGMVETLKRRLNRNRLPLALLAIHDGQPVGTVSLKLKEVAIRPQYEHWLGTLYVHQPYRGRGIGSLLVEAAIKVAAQLGVGELYLYTRHPKTEGLYAKLGWVVVERPEYRGRPAVIMKQTPIHRS
jgi:GNAT superfamily N-acetyltransferase